MELAYIYPTIAAGIIVGFHVFFLKYLGISIKPHKNKNIKYILLFFIIITAIISRIFFYMGLQTTNHPVFIQTVVNITGIFVVLILSAIVLKKKVNYLIFTIGVILTFSGLYVLQKSLY